MTKKQLTHLLSAQRPEPPKGFEARIERQLCRLTQEDTAMKKRYRISTALIAAVLTVVILAGAALAASELHLLSSWLGKTAVPDVQERIATNLGDTENPLASLTVEEAVYDGRNVALSLLLTPQNPVEDALLCRVWLLEDISKEEYDIRETQHKEGMYSQELIGRKDGKRILTWWPAVSLNGQEMEAEAIEIESLEDGSARVYLQYNLDPSSEETTILCEVSAHITPYLLDEEAQLLPVLTFDLTRIPDEKTYALIPDENSLFERCHIERGYVTFAHLMGYMNLEYVYTPNPGEEMGITWRLLDEAGNMLDGAAEETKYLGNSRYYQKNETQALSEIPEFLYLEAKVIGEDKILGRAKCRLVEADPSEFLEPTPAPEPLRKGVYLTAKASWEGEHIRLLEGLIYENRHIRTAFLYDGTWEDAARIDLVYKTVEGTIVGPSIARVGVVHDGWYEYTDQLDGSGWPTAITIEFVLDGKVLDAFTCELHPLPTSEKETATEIMARIPLPAAIDPAHVFTAPEDTCYHTRPGCGGRENALCTTQENAVNMGKTPCALCCAAE